MQQVDLFLVFTVPLESVALTYMVSGSVASMVYGEPRLTNDVDIVLDLDHRRIKALASAFPAASFYCPPEEVLAIESRRARRGHFNLIHHETGHKADIYLCGSDPLQAWGLSHRRRVDLKKGKYIWLAPPEYVILRKLEYFKEGASEKHQSDIRGMLDVSGEQLDASVLKEWIPRLGVESEWAVIAQGFELG